MFRLPHYEPAFALEKSPLFFLSWFHSAGELLYKITKRERGFIASDETVLWNHERGAYLWAAREIRIGEVIAVQVSRGRGLGRVPKHFDHL